MELNIEIAKSLFTQNKYQETIDTCNEILATDNHSIEALKLLAKSFLATRKIDGARIYLSKALSIKPDDYEAIKDLGNTFQAVGDINTAKQYYQKAIDINSSYAPALTNLGSIELIEGKKQDALSLLIKATESDPQLAPAWGNLANCYIQLGKMQEAELSTLKAIQFNPELADFYQNLGLLLCAQGKINLAVENIEKAVSIDPISKNNQLLLSIFRAKQRKESQDMSNPVDIEISKKKSSSDPFILNRRVEPELINSLYEIEAIDLNKFQDPSFGKARGSDYKLFEDNKKITQKLEKDLTTITKGVVNSDVFFLDSFFTILSGNSIIKKHNHIVGNIDNFPSLNLCKKKYSLVYYLRVGDQDCPHPGLLKFYSDKDNINPNEEILPLEGMIVIFPADRYHSVRYEGKKDRIIVGVNFYSI